MKIKADIIKGFIERVHIEGIFNQLIFDFTEEGLKVGVKSESNVIGVIGFLDKNNFENYVALGKIGLMNINILLRIFSKYFNNEIELDFKRDKKGIEYNKLIINSGENYFEQDLENLESLKYYKVTLNSINKIPFEEEIVIDNSNRLKEILYAVPILECHSLNLNIEEKQLKTIIEEGNKLYTFEKTFVLNSKVRNKYFLNFNEDFFKLIKVLEDKIIIRLNNEMNIPIVIYNENKYGNFKYVFAKNER